MRVYDKIKLDFNKSCYINGTNWNTSEYKKLSINTTLDKAKHREKESLGHMVIFILKLTVAEESNNGHNT